VRLRPPRPKPPPRRSDSARDRSPEPFTLAIPTSTLLCEEADLSGGFTPIQAPGGHDYCHLCVILCDDHSAALIVPALKPDRSAPHSNGIGGNPAH
jgi:hypothetical protein